MLKNINFTSHPKNAKKCSLTIEVIKKRKKSSSEKSILRSEQKEKMIMQCFTLVNIPFNAEFNNMKTFKAPEDILVTCVTYLY